MNSWGKWVEQPDVYVLLGYPLHKTMSPPMHNAAFQHLEMDSVYLPLPVAANRLKFAMEAMRTFCWHGANVTIPHKRSVLTMLDSVDELATKIGAVNTVTNNNGHLRGYNTDVQGFLLSFPENLVGSEPIALLGAGGAARAVAFALVSAGCSTINILNRTLGHAKELKLDILKHFPQTNITVADFSDRNQHLLKDAVAIINCTPVDFPFNRDWLEAGNFANCKCAYDLRYQASYNAFLNIAGAQGVSLLLDGKEMLLGQAVLAFNLWTGKKAPIEVMRSALYVE